MGNKGSILALDRDPKRLKRLQDNAKLTGAEDIAAQCKDFLQTDPSSSGFSAVTGILLDPSCSGSGTVRDKELPHFPLPSNCKERAPLLPEFLAIFMPMLFNIQQRAFLQVHSQMDNLLSDSKSDDKKASANRLKALTDFQKKALLHALSFPHLQRLVYSTCSVSRRSIFCILLSYRCTSWERKSIDSLSDRIKES